MVKHLPYFSYWTLQLKRFPTQINQNPLSNESVLRMSRKNVHLFLKGYKRFFLQLDFFFYYTITNFPIFPQLNESVLIDISCIASDNDVFTPHLFRKDILVLLITIIFSAILFNATAVAQEKRKQHQFVNLSTLCIRKENSPVNTRSFSVPLFWVYSIDLPKIILCKCLKYSLFETPKYL